jgi:ParB family protein of integrating conjugative element (PFGI_1 class)
MISPKARSPLGLSVLTGRKSQDPPHDPPGAMLIEVDLDAIQPYDLNPRRAENPEFFDRLCASIESQGLDNPIPITRRPNETKYVVAAGGNTRLKVFQALRDKYPEDSRFRKMPCVFRPYTSEIDLIAAHLRENELRDPLTFIDHAIAIIALKRRLDEESGGEPMSAAAYERWLDRMGHRVSRRDLGRMEYAVEYLDEAIPLALRHGTGHHRLVDLIAKYHRCYGMYWDNLDVSVTESTAFDPLFLNALNAHDAEFLSLETVRDSLDHRIMQVTGIPVHRIRAGVEALLNLSGSGDRASDRRPASSPVAPEPAPSPSKHSPETAAAPTSLIGNHSVPQEVPPEESFRVAEPDAAPDQVPLHRQPQMPESETRRISAPSGNPAAVGSGGKEVRPSPEATPVDTRETYRPCSAENPEFTELHHRVAGLAAQVAQAAGLQRLVQPDREAPAGFTLLDLPAEAATQERVVWWLLHAVSADRGFDDVPPDDPVAFARYFLYGFPPDRLLSPLLQLVESIMALAKAESDSSIPQSHM